MDDELAAAGAGAGAGAGGDARRRCSTWPGRGCWRRLAGRDDVVFGTVLFGRMRAGRARTGSPGPFMNTLPVRVRAGAGRVAGAVAAMQAQLAGLLAHEHAPLALAQQASGVPAPAPLFTSLLNYRHSPRPAAQPTPAAWRASRAACQRRGRTNYPLTVSVDDTGDRFAVTVDAVAPVSPGAGRARCCMTATDGLVTALEHAPATPLRRIAVLDAGGAGADPGRVERHRGAGAGGHAAGVVRGAGGAVPRMRSRWCAGSGADVMGSWTRGRAGWRGYLRGGGRGRSVVAVVMERSAELVVALLAVCEGGGGVPAGGPGLPGGADRRSCWPTPAAWWC